jgi:hypothetical protein
MGSISSKKNSPTIKLRRIPRWDSSGRPLNAAARRELSYTRFRQEGILYTGQSVASFLAAILPQGEANAKTYLYKSFRRQSNFGTHKEARTFTPTS